MDTSIAIVGMSCRFAGCGTTDALWDAVMRRESMLTVPGSDTELPRGYTGVFKRPYPTRLGQLGELYSCNPSMQNFPRQLNAGENQDLYFATQLAFDALLDAGMRPHRRSQVRGSVRVGYAPPFNASTVNWLQHTAFLEQTIDIIRRFMPQAPEKSIDSVREQLRESLPEPNAASFLLGTGYRFASWIARECSFGGVSEITDAGMLTGAAVLMDAMSDLISGRVNVALAGAFTPPLSRAYLEGLAGEVDFSTATEFHPFSASPVGTIPGEGGAFFVLKRREDALADHDRIYALLRTISIGHNPEDDSSAMFAETAERAGAPISSIGLIEADGSGIAISENRELEAIGRLLGEHRPGKPLVGIGSIKGNIGHTLRASIVAGVVKTAIALHRKVLPPQIAPDKAAPSLSTVDSSAYLLTEARPWITGDSASPRRAMVIGYNFEPISPIGTAVACPRSAVLLMEEEPEVRG